MNISFVTLVTEECEQCGIQAQHMEDDHSAHNALEPDGVCIHRFRWYHLCYHVII